MMRPLVALVLLGAPLAPRPDVPQVGQPAPDFDLETLEGGRARLAAYRGHPVLVNFWASWCKPCSEEMPEIILAYGRLHEAGLEVLAVNLTDQERKKDVRRFADELQLPFPVALDARGTVRRRYGLIGVPMTVFVDSAGIVRAVHPGPLTTGTLNRGLATILRAPETTTAKSPTSY
jgi:peroxiredoxin